MSKLNNQSFNLMKALEEAETFEINKKVTVDSYHENLIESKKLVESDYYYDDDFNERTKYLIQRISDVETFIKLLIQEFGEYEYEDEEDKEADYNYEEGGHVIQVGGTTFYTNEAMNDIWSYDNGDPSDTMEELLDNENIAEFLLGEGLISDEDDRFEDEFDESVNLTEERLGNNTFTDRDEAEGFKYNNKEYTGLDTYTYTFTLDQEDEFKKAKEELAKTGTVTEIFINNGYGLEYKKDKNKINESRLGNNTFTDRDEAEYYRNKELYHQSGLARHKEAMEKAKEACKSKGIEVDETEGVYESATLLTEGKEEIIQKYLNRIKDLSGYNDKTLKSELDKVLKELDTDKALDDTDRKFMYDKFINTMLDNYGYKKKTVDETEGVYESCNKKLKEDEDTSKEERLASLKTQLEQDGDQLSDDEKEAIQAEINELENEESLTEASTPNVEKFIYDLDADSGNAWSVNYNDRKRGVEVYKNGKSEKTVDDIIKAVTSKYPQLKVSMKGKNTVLFKYDDKNKSLKEAETPEAMQAIADKQMPEGGYRYMARHSIGPGTLPNDIKVFKTEDTDNGKIAMYISRPLTSEELKKYDIDPEWIQEGAVPKLADYQNAFSDNFNKIYNIGTYEDGMGDLDIYKNNKRVGSIYRNDDNKYEVTLRKHFKEKVVDTWQDAVKLLNDVASEVVTEECDKSLKEEYSEKLGGDPEDFISDCQSILEVLNGIDTESFGTHLAQQMIEEWIETAESQIKMAKSKYNLEEDEDIDSEETEEETLEDTINRAHEEELSAIETYNAVLDKTDESTDTKLIEMINEIKADEEDHKLLLQHYIETGEALSDDELEALKNSEELIEESENRIAEEKVTNLKEVKSQGNIFMLQDNKRFIVGENYDEAQGLIENAEIYDNKNDADKDYLDRCDITKDGKKVQLNGQDEMDKE